MQAARARWFRVPWAALCFVTLPGFCQGEVAQWSEPAIDSWFYSNGFSGGSRILSPSFAGVEVDEQTGVFFTNSEQGPARLGATLLAFETEGSIAAGLDPNRYVINSLTVTAKSQTGGFFYEDQTVTAAGLLAQATGSGITEQQPMELFGVGFRDGYVGFDLGPASPGPRFAESDAPYSGAGYVAYPVIGDGAGGYHDVSNSFSGGFSETAPGSQTDPFDAEPWAVGSAPYTAGQPVAADTTYRFDLDLNEPGVQAYLQQSLADGSVGFFLTSMHPAGFQGAGGGAYPQWYTKESVGLFDDAAAPTLSIDFDILPIAGDYDADGAVTELDYAEWVSNYGKTESTPGLGADGNRDGVVDAADYTVWKDNLSPASGASSVPEPTAGVCAWLTLTAVSFRARTTTHRLPQGSTS